MTHSLKKTDSPFSGVMPDVTRLWAGRGTGKPCEFCGKAIAADDIQYEIETTADLRGVTDTRGRTLSFHVNCYDSWRAYRNDVC